MEVLWKSIPGYEGIYEVSNTGQVRGKNGIRKPQETWDGYQYVKLCRRGHEKKYKVHRLVALAFIPNPLGLAEINHRDENKRNNHVLNLEWCDRVYNDNYGSRNNRAAESIRKAKQKSVSCYDKSGNFICTFESAKEAGKEMNIAYSCITGCARGRRKSAGGYIWKYCGKESAGN